MKPRQGTDPAETDGASPAPVLRPVGSGTGLEREDAGRQAAFTSRWRYGHLWFRAAPLLAIVAVAVPATVLRLWKLNAISFNSDEAVYAGRAAGIASDPHLSKLFPVFRAQPPLFQMVTSLVYRFHVRRDAGPGFDVWDTRTGRQQPCSDIWPSWAGQLARGEAW